MCSSCTGDKDSAKYFSRGRSQDSAGRISILVTSVSTHLVFFLMILKLLGQFNTLIRYQDTFITNITYLSSNMIGGGQINNPMTFN